MKNKCDTVGCKIDWDIKTISIYGRDENLCRPCRDNILVELQTNKLYRASLTYNAIDYVGRV